MVKELIHDPILLSIKSEVATKEDLQVAQDLLDTLTAHKDGCVGMAANMIGVHKRTCKNSTAHTKILQKQIRKIQSPPSFFSASLQQLLQKIKNFICLKK